MDTSKIKQVPLKETEYLKEVRPKNQIVLHHTAGNSSAINVVRDWNGDTRGRIATCIVVSGKGAKDSFDGEIIQAFSSKYWAHHLGIKPEVFSAKGLPYKKLDPHSIGIEICNWGQLEKIGDKYFNYVDREVLKEDVCELAEPFKGYKFFHNYTEAQIQSVKELILYWADLYKINFKFDYDQMFTVSLKALRGENGLFTHNSYRKDKVDIYPHPKMIEMLKSL